MCCYVVPLFGAHTNTNIWENLMDELLVDDFDRFPQKSFDSRKRKSRAYVRARGRRKNERNKNFVMFFYSFTFQFVDPLVGWMYSSGYCTNIGEAQHLDENKSGKCVRGCVCVCACVCGEKSPISCLNEIDESIYRIAFVKNECFNARW